MSSAKKVIANTLFLYSRMGITMFISLYVTRVVLHSLGAESFGLYNLIIGSIAMFGFFNASLTAATQRFMSYANGANDIEGSYTVFNVSLLLHISVAIVIAIVLHSISPLMFNNILNIHVNALHSAQMLYLVLIYSTVITIISVPFDAVINAHENMLLLSVLGIIEAFLRLFVAWLLIHVEGDRLIFYGFCLLIISLIVLLFKIFYCFNQYHECKVSRKYLDKSSFQRIFSFAGWTMMGSAASMVAFYGQSILINNFFGSVYNASHGIANQISGQLSALSTTMLQALNPSIAKTEGSGNREKMIEISFTGSKFSFYLLSVIFVPIIIEMPFILNIWLKEVPPLTIIFCRLVLLKNLVDQLMKPINSSINAVGSIKRHQILNSMLWIFALVASYFVLNMGFPAYSMHLVYLIFSLVFGINILNSAIRNVQLSASRFFKEVIIIVFLIFVLQIGLAAIPLLIFDQGLLRFALVCIISFVSFIAFLWVFGINKTEKKLLVSIASKFSSGFQNKFHLKGLNI